MHLSNFTFATSLFVISAMASPLAVRSENDQGLQLICQYLKTENNGCIRCKFPFPYLSTSKSFLKSHNPDTKGFDVTSVVTKVDLKFPQVKDECDCVQECLNRPSTCPSYVYKFSAPASVQSVHRTCTLYSQFNLPFAVTVLYDLSSTNNVSINAAEIIIGNNPQTGAVVPQTFKGVNLNTTADGDAVSGYVFCFLILTNNF